MGSGLALPSAFTSYWVPRSPGLHFLFCKMGRGPHIVVEIRDSHRRGLERNFFPRIQTDALGDSGHVPQGYLLSLHGKSVAQTGGHWLLTPAD